MKIKLLLLAVFFFLYGTNLMSQNIDTVRTKKQIDHSFTMDASNKLSNDLLVINSLNQQVGFQVSHDQATWETFLLKPKQSVSISTIEIERFFLKIWTKDKKFKIYQISKNKKYVIRYDIQEESFVLNTVYFD